MPGVGGTAGVPLASLDYRNGENGRRERADYCVDNDFLAALDRMTQRAQRAGNGYPMEQRVRYILTTGGNWRAPIGDFRLVVDKGRADAIVSFCGEGVRRISPTRFEVRHRNWRPDPRPRRADRGRARGLRRLSAAKFPTGTALSPCSLKMLSFCSTRFAAI